MTAHRNKAAVSCSTGEASNGSPPFAPFLLPNGRQKFGLTSRRADQSHLTIRKPASGAHERRAEQLRALVRESEACFCAFFVLQYRPRRHDAKRRRRLVLRVVNVVLRFIGSGQSSATVVTLDRALRVFPRAAWLRAARICTLLVEGDPEGRASLIRYAGHKICSVRFENLVFWQLREALKASAVSRVVGEVETLLDCVQPSAAELQRIRLRLQDLADADIPISAFDRGPRSETPASAGTPQQPKEPGSTVKPFGSTDLKISPIETITSPMVAKLRRAALRWRCNYARQFRSQELRQVYDLGLPTHIWQLTEIVRKLIRQGHVEVAIYELDAGLAIFPDSALLNALRACAGMIAGRPSGPDILRYYRGQTVNGMGWEEIIFDQLDRVRRAPGVIHIVGDVERILGSTRPSARERRNTRVSIMHAAPGMFPTRIDEEVEEARDRDFIAAGLGSALFPPVGASGFLVADRYRRRGEYQRALHCYFLQVYRCLIPPMPRSKKARGEAHAKKAYALCCISHIAWQLLRRGKFERVLSAAEQALLTYPDSGNLHACRAAALMLLDRVDEALEVYHRLMAYGLKGVLTIQATFDALRAGGHSHHVMEELAVQLPGA